MTSEPGARPADRHTPRRGRLYAAGSADVSAAASVPSAGHPAWASVPGTRTPLPPHHGQLTLLGVPPRLEITWPLPRQGIHSRGPWDPSA